jgi:hypothetical protein
MAKRKIYYVTKKRVERFIELHVKEVGTYTKFLDTCKEILTDLEENKSANKTQIRFFKKVEKRVTVKAVIEHLPK